MKAFMTDDFLLSTDTAKELFSACREEPIFDWHCHLPPKEIYENRQPADIAELWLGGDHYKWRAMRSCGIDEEYITGAASNHDKFIRWAQVMDECIGNPLYHWTHLELQRYFDIYTHLSPRTAEAIWEQANAKIKEGGFTPRELMERSNVRCVFTTDDPADSLEYHKLIAADPSFKIRVSPAFRPDKALNVEKPTFPAWLQALEAAVGRSIGTFAELKTALLERMDYFDSLGCRASDQALTYVPCVEATDAELQTIFEKGKNGEAVGATDADKYKTALLRFLAENYHDKGWRMEIHIGALRDNNTAMFRKIGADTGFDSINDRGIAEGLSRFMDSLAVNGRLPGTILFTLNPKDNFVLGAMLGNFQSSEAPSKIQFGTAWWFNDNIDGMRAQMRALANLGMLGRFIGMITDSRSFLSYPRHEYFRRILCGLIGEYVENGEYPADMELLSRIVKNISFNNAAEYFGIQEKS